jgi:hypothetical protein
LFMEKCLRGGNHLQNLLGAEVLGQLSVGYCWVYSRGLVLKKLLIVQELRIRETMCVLLQQILGKLLTGSESEERSYQN